MADLVLRVDAGAEIGAGHAMRLLALAEAWRARGGSVRLVGTIGIEFVADRAATIGIAPESGPLTSGDVLIVDTNDPAERHRAAREGGFGTRVLVDDLGGPVPAGYDVVWNPNPYGIAALYPDFAGRVLTGPGVVPLRTELPSWAGPGDGSTVLSMGGGTPTRGVIDALHRLARLLPRERFQVAGRWGPRRWPTVDPGGLWSAASRASRLVTAAGTTTWEAAAVGVPVVLVQLADNQRLVFRWARDCGVPGVDATVLDGEKLARQLSRLLPLARPLPPLTGGAGQVVAELCQRLASPCP